MTWGGLVTQIVQVLAEGFFLSLKDPGSVSHVIHLIALFSQTPEPGAVRTLTPNPIESSQ